VQLTKQRWYDQTVDEFERNNMNDWQARRDESGGSSYLWNEQLMWDFDTKSNAWWVGQKTDPTNLANNRLIVKEKAEASINRPVDIICAMDTSGTWHLKGSDSAGGMQVTWNMLYLDGHTKAEVTSGALTILDAEAP